jgi:hypothetical protein
MNNKYTGWKLILLLDKQAAKTPVPDHLNSYYVNNMLKRTKEMFTITLLPVQGWKFLNCKFEAQIKTGFQK